jgi:surface protein
MKTLSLSLIILLLSIASKASQFITVWDLAYIGTSSMTIKFGVVTTGTVSYTWETIPAGTAGSGTFNGPIANITLPWQAKIRLKIDSANFISFNMNNGIDKNRLFDVEQWGTITWSSMANAFHGCNNLNISATDIPDLSSVTDMSYMFAMDAGNVFNSPLNIDNWNTGNITNMSNLFANANLFNQPIGSWNTSNVTNMSRLFYGATSFNQSIGNWNTMNVTDMSYMFTLDIAFNQAIGNWNTMNVTDMSFMFAGARNFNQPIGNWNTSNVINMQVMFANANKFNQPIDNWNVSQVTWFGNLFVRADSFNQPIGSWNVGNAIMMGGMFERASSFNQPLNNWNTVNVISMSKMFKNATSFNQNLNSWNTANVTKMISMFDSAISFNLPINNWNIDSVTSMSYMFNNALNFNQPLGNLQFNQNIDLTGTLNNCGMDCINYSSTLHGWANNSNLPNNLNLGSLNIYYGTSVQSERNYLINAKGWIITGDTLSNNACCLSSTNNTIIQSSCNSFYFNNQSLTTSGIYLDTLINAAGCDSFLTLYLTIINSTTNTITETDCDSFYFNNQICTASGVYLDTLVNGIGCDSFLTLNLTIIKSTTNTITETACDSFYFNGHNLTSSGVYKDTFINAAGCDSIITLNLTINSVSNNNVTQNGTTLTASNSAATYQWIECNPYTIIVGAINQSYTATSNGDYAVILTENACTDTSVCVPITNVGIKDLATNHFTITPNPAANQIAISANQSFTNASITIYSITGQTIFTVKKINSKEQIIDISKFANGVYYVEMKQLTSKEIAKFIKQ